MRTTMTGHAFLSRLQQHLAGANIIPFEGAPVHGWTPRIRTYGSAGFALVSLAGAGLMEDAMDVYVSVNGLRSGLKYQTAGKGLRRPVNALSLEAKLREVFAAFGVEVTRVMHCYTALDTHEVGYCVRCVLPDWLTADTKPRRARAQPSAVIYL